DGVMVTGQVGYGDEYKTRNAGVIAGTHWDTGNFFAAYNYSWRSALQFKDREFLNRDKRALGGTNFGTFNCSPASIQPQGATGIYVSPTATSPIANTAANSPCQLVAEGDIFPEEERNNAMFKIRQDVGDSLTVGLDAVYSRVTNSQRTSRGSITSTV